MAFEPTPEEKAKVRLIDSLTLSDIKDFLLKEGVDTSSPRIFELSRTMIGSIPKEYLNGETIAAIVVILTCQLMEVYDSIDEIK
jgi:hypothetical protein